MPDTNADGGDFYITPEDITATPAIAEQTTGNVTEQLAVVKGYILSFEGAWHGLAEQPGRSSY